MTTEETRACKVCRAVLAVECYELRMGQRLKTCPPCRAKVAIEQGRLKLGKLRARVDALPDLAPVRCRASVEEIERRTAAMRAAKLEWMRKGGGISLPRSMARAVDLEGGR